jgi:hypothetical protein
MEHSLFLRQYKIEILRSASQPALLAFFDFESGDFQLEGDGQFIKSNNHIKKSRLNDKHTSLLIQANMKPEIPAGPNDNLNNELLLLLKGSFYNGRQQHRCSGLLRLNRSYKDNKAQWTIYCNLVDNDLDFFEIKLTLPVFTSLVNTAGSN